MPRQAVPTNRAPLPADGLDRRLRNGIGDDEVEILDDLLRRLEGNVTAETPTGSS